MPSPSDVTVIVCTRDRPEMLQGALAAIHSSTPPETAILVVDSASSTSETRDVAAAAGVGYVRSGKGLSVARNVGITTADRPIVIFTDDDCRPTQGWVEKLIGHFDEDAVSAATGRMLDHAVSADVPYHRQTRYTRPLSGIDAGHGAVMAFRREVLLRLGGFDDLMGAGQRMAGAEDLDIFIRILRGGTGIVHDGTCVVLHANTRVGDAYVALHRGYGRGLGALVSKWLRTDPAFGVSVGWRLSGRTIVRIARSRLAGKRADHDLAMLVGMIDGIRATWRTPLVGERFVPPWQSGGIPALVTIAASAAREEPA